MPAQLFFREMGFRAITVLRGFYDENEEDAYVMEYKRMVEKTVLPINRISAKG